MTAPGRTVRTVAAAVALLVTLLAGCTAPAAEQVAGDAAPEGSAPAPPTPPAAAPSTPADDGSGDVAAQCGDELEALDAVITEQLDAFAADDWQRAWSLTSREFRAAGIDADGLREIVTTGYPEAADAADHEVVGCLFGRGEAQVLIAITATDGATADLVYLLTREDGRWRISGAVDHDSGPSEPDTTTA
jgi:hypothetical protein